MDHQRDKKMEHEMEIGHEYIVNTWVPSTGVFLLQNLQVLTKVVIGLFEGLRVRFTVLCF